MLENPVLQRELLVNLRMPRAFVLLLVYQVALAAVVYFAWPKDNIRLDLTSSSGSSSQLVDLFFLGQYILASLMAPSFAAGAISGEKERMTYEMLLASPIKPESIVFGKLVAALTHLAILIFASLPIVMLCLPLGGVSLYEVLAAYLALIVSAITFGMISVACGSFFSRTSSSLVVSYLMILPLALMGVLFWALLSNFGETRLKLAVTVIPGIAAAITIPLFYVVSARMLYPPDVGSEGKEVVDLETEASNAVGLVIQRDQFPDRLFAPPLRETLMPDNANPIYDKEMRSEIFGQGTLMLRLAIQISMILAIFMMAAFLFVLPEQAGWYVCYVILFNILIGPVFSAGSVTSERERQTLDLLLTTTIGWWEILWGKLLSGLRVSSVLSGFLLFPLLLATLLVPEIRSSIHVVACYLVIFALSCLTTASLALFCSTLFRKTTASLIATYSIILLLYLLPLAGKYFGETYFPESHTTTVVTQLTVVSPFSAAIELPISSDDGWMGNGSVDRFPDLRDDQQRDPFLHFASYAGFTIALDGLLLVAMIWMFNSRWRVASMSE